MEAGVLLREVRRRHGVTQAQLAARARTSQAAISRIERGLVSPSVSTLATLLDLLGEKLQLTARPIDYGHDRSLLERNLAMTVSERIDHGAELAEFVRRNRGAALPSNSTPRRSTVDRISPSRRPSAPSTSSATRTARPRTTS